MLEGFKTIVIQNKVQSVPRAVLSNGALTINKSAITRIVDKGFIEVGVDRNKQLERKMKNENF